MEDKESIKTLIEVLNERNLENTDIMYRTNSPVEAEEDMLMGYCRYENGNLISLDGDSYCLDDEIVKYEMSKDDNGNEYLVVWTESEWA